MDSFDEVRSMEIPGIPGIPESNNSCTNANNGYHTHSDNMQNNYMSNDATNINYKVDDNTATQDFHHIDNAQQNQQNTNTADFHYDKPLSSAEQPSVTEDTQKEKSDFDKDAKENGDNDKNDEIQNSEEDVATDKQNISNGIESTDIKEESENEKKYEENDALKDENNKEVKENKENDIEMENEEKEIKQKQIDEEMDEKEKEGKENEEKEINEKEVEKKDQNEDKLKELTNLNIKNDDDEDDDDDLVPLAKRSNFNADNKKNNKSTPVQKRGPRGPYNKNRSKAESGNASSNQQNDEVDENQCRVCLVKEDLISIFKTDNKQSIADKLMTVCSGIRIQKKDFLPQFICNTCMQSVQVAYNLKVLCETTDKDLRSKLSRSKKKMRRPAPTEYVLIDATKFPSDDSEGDQEDGDDEFKLSNEEIVKSSESDATDSGSNYGSRRRSRRVRTKKTQQKRKSRSSAVVAPKIIAPPVVITPKIIPSSTNKRNRKESSSPEKRISIDFSSGSEDNYAPPQRKQRKDSNRRTGPGPGAVNAPKEAQCPYCNEMFPSQSALMKHKKTHSNQPLNCDMCGKNFKLLAAYQAHIDKHKSDGDSLKCEKCEKTFTKLVERKRHMIEIHNEKPETFPCEKCRRVFALKKTLERHLEEGKCPGPKSVKPVTPTLITSTLQKKTKSDMESLTLGRDLFKCVAPVTTTYWSDSFSD